MNLERAPCVLIPAKSLAHGKSRLAAALGARSRRALNLLLLRRAMRVAAQFAGAANCVVVSPCDEVLRLAQRRGLRTLRDPGSEGLNAALEHAMAEVSAAGDRELLLMSTDMPHLRAQDLAAMAAMGRRHVCPVLGADRHGSGTNLMYLPAGLRLPLSYGQDSLPRHVASGRRLAGRVLVYRSEEVAFDIDTPQDLRRWLGPPHPALAAAVRGAGLSLSTAPAP